MKLHVALATTLLAMLTSPTCMAQNSFRTPSGATFVVDVMSTRFGTQLLGGRGGHGICLDSPCIHVLSNYHVAGQGGKVTVEGVAARSVRSWTQADDPAAMAAVVLGRVQPLNTKR